MLYITGDTHGEQGRFLYQDAFINKALTEEDKLFICGDFGYVMRDSFHERKFLDYLAERPYEILFVDGNHENFDLLESFPVEEYWGGKVHVIARDAKGKGKIIHLMRGQVFTIEGQKIFTMGGGFSRDKAMRSPHVSWWPQEMPQEEEMAEAVENLGKHQNKVDYIITHTAPLSTVERLGKVNPEELPLNHFLEWARVNISFTHWYFGHLHKDKSLWLGQIALWFDVRNMITGELVEE